MSISITHANQLPGDITIGEDGIYVVILDTDSYAGNFEREMAAYAAGAYDSERYHGDTQFHQFVADAEEVDAGILRSIVSKVGYANHDEYGDVSNTIWATPGVLNTGAGAIVPDDGVNTGYPAYNSVAIFFDEKPTDEELECIYQRAVDYGQTQTGWNGDQPPVNVAGVRCLAFKTQVTEITAPTVESTVTIYGLSSDLGDGSGSIRWFRDKDIVDMLLNDDSYCEEYWANEGSPNSVLTFPATLDLEKCGFRFADSYYSKG